MSEDYGYGEVDTVARKTSSGGKYLKLDPDREYQLRIASRPRYAIGHWINNRTQKVNCEGEECKYCGKDVKDKVEKTAQWGWIVIDREDGKVKILQGPNSVALALKSLSELTSKTNKDKKMWGDPTTFDVLIKKEKQSSGFWKYNVNPVPENKGPMSEEEKALVEKSGIDLERELKNSKQSEHLGNYGKNQSLETAPESDRAEVPADLGEEGKSDESVDPDDIPF